MEKFYIAEEGSKLRKDYLEHLESAKKVRKLAIQLFETHGITAKEYYANNNYIHIVPTEEDKEKFSNQLCKPKDGLYRFRANSKINRAWVRTLEANEVQVISRPMVPLYFGIYWGGRMQSRLFEIDGVVYCSFNADGEFKPKDKLTEIKASEFFKVIEDYNERIKENENAI